MHPRYPRQFDASERFARQLQTQHDVDIKRLWDAQRAHLNPFSGTSDIELPPNPTTSTTTASPPCCASYSCADVFIPDVFDYDGETVLVGGWFRLTGSPNTCAFYYLNTEAPARHPLTISLDRNPGAYGHGEFSLRVTGYAAALVGCEWKLGSSLSCPGPNTQGTGYMLQYGSTIADPNEPRAATATATLVSCSDPTSTTTTTSTTTAEPTTTTTTTTTSTSSTTPGDLPTTTTTTSTTTAGGGGGTTTTTSTTTSGGCGVCLWEWAFSGSSPVWVKLADCNPGCACGQPPRDGLYLGEFYVVDCIL